MIEYRKILSHSPPLPVVSDHWPGSQPACTRSLAAEEFACFLLGLLKYLSLRVRKVFTGAVDVKVQHRHRRLVGRALAPCADIGGMLKRPRDLGRVGRGEN